MSKWFVALLVWLSLAVPVAAQNPMCPTRPNGDNTNACASTAFVHTGGNAGLAVGTTPITGGSNGFALYDNSGFLGNFALGSGVMAALGNGLNTSGGVASFPIALPQPLEVGTSLYPTIVPGVNSRYDTTSDVLTNTLGAKNANIGVAAIDGVTWVTSGGYLPGADTPGQVTLYVINPIGGFSAILDASRSSDSSVFDGNIVAGTDLIVGDNTGQNQLLFGRYIETVLPSGSGYRQAIGQENSMWNQNADGPVEDPFTPNPFGAMQNLRLDCGVGTGPTPHICSTALDIVNNGSTYQSGVVFQNGMLNPRGGILHMIDAPNQAEIVWYSSAGTISGTIGINASNQFNIVATGGIAVAGTAAVSCAAGTVTLATLVVTDGIVTHC